MTKTFKRLLSALLVFTLLICGTVPVLAVDDEEYISDLRIIYADNYDEALDILESSEFDDYKLLDVNLNENTGKTGVWLAYQVTTDIEEAITDISVMEMQGGYREGNYREMIEKSKAEYKAMGENYLEAIEYFKKGYDAGHYLSAIAFRQLNFYNVVTEGIEDIPEFEGEHIGDIFLSGIDVGDLATMFMEGNSYALSNIRSLIAMGVSYNEDGMTYLEKVAVEAAKYAADNSIYENENYDEIAPMVASTITVLRDMFKELATYESELNYEDEELTELEVKYMTHKALAELMRGVNYLGDTLYSFALKYNVDKENYSNLYPLIAALNDGQLAMTKVAHYYDVIRYSVVLDQNSDIDAELDNLEERYSENPFNIYTGVDRTIYRDTFALTSEAYRADAFTESGLSALLFDSGYYATENTVFAIGAVITLAGIGPHIYGYLQPQKYLEQYNQILLLSKIEFGQTNLISAGPYARQFADEAMNKIFTEVVTDESVLYQARVESWGFAEKFDYVANNKILTDDPDIIAGWRQIDEDLGKYLQSNDMYMDSERLTNQVLDRADTITNVAYGMYIVGGLMMLISAVKMGIGVYNYYHPDYDDIPVAMVDLIDTVDGDRYIKYDVVFEAESKDDGSYAAADLNAFSASRWNALYYTKSYEAGKPLLADEFRVSHKNHTPGNNYMPIHKFGEVICFNLNKHSYNDDYSIYLSVKQSDNQKSAVADVPQLIGSVFSTGYLMLAGGIGIMAGVGATIGVEKLVKKRRSDAASEA